MRKELDRMEEIEKYLNQGLSKEDRDDFEARLQQQTDLAEEVQMQELLQGAIQRRALRLTTRKAYTSYRWHGGGLLKGIGLLVIGVGVAALLFVDDVKSDPEPAEQNIEHSEPTQSATSADSLR